MKRDRKTFYICLTGLMAALACVSNYISIATPASRLHIGNAVCVLSGLLLGPLYGFFAAAIGNGLFDIIGGYGMEFIMTLRFTTGAVDPVAVQATMLSKAASSLFNAAFAFIVAPIFFNVLRKPLRGLGLYA